MSLLTVRLPSKGKVLVTVGQTVSVGDPLAKKESSFKSTFDLARLFKTKPQKVKKLLLKKVGEEVREGEVLAQKKTLFTKSKLKSPAAGILEKLDEESGILTIKTPQEDFTLRAKVAGKVVKIKEEEEIIVDFEGIEIEAERGMGPKKEGEITVLKDSPVHLSHLNLDLAGKLVAAGVFGCGTLSKAKALGIEAILACEIEDENHLKSTGEKSFSFLVFSPDNFAKVLKYESFHAVVWGEEKSLVVSRK